MVYVTLNPILYQSILNNKKTSVCIRKRYVERDMLARRENGSVTSPEIEYLNRFIIKIMTCLLNEEFVIYILNMKDCERTRKLLPRILDTTDYEIVELTNELPRHTHSSIWHNNEVYLGCGHHAIISTRKLSDIESELVFGEYFQSSCLTLDFTETPQLQFIQLERPLFLIVYCQHESLLNKCKQDLLSKGIDVKLQSEIELIDKWLDYKNFEKMLEVEKRCNQKQSTIVSYI